MSQYSQLWNKHISGDFKSIDVENPLTSEITDIMQNVDCGNGFSDQKKCLMYKYRID